jgi:hypothetical protein
MQPQNAPLGAESNLTSSTSLHNELISSADSHQRHFISCVTDDLDVGFVRIWVYRYLQVVFGQHDHLL